MGDKTLSHLLKHKKFYENNNLKFYLVENIPTADGIDCLCDNPKGCGYSCHSGTPCKLFKPNFRFYKRQESGTDPSEIDYDKDYFKVEKSILELKIEALETRILELEKLILENIKK